MSYYSFVRYSAGGAGTYAVTFPYIDKAHVAVLDNGAAYTGTVTWASDASVTLSPDIVSGHTVTIIRSTPKTPIVTFGPGALSSSDLNLAETQELYLSQELADLATGGVPVVVMPGGGGGGGGGGPYANQDLSNVTTASLRDASLVTTNGGTRSRRLGVIFADLANVNDYLNSGDTTYDGAIARALADRGKAYFPYKPSLGTPAYNIASAIAVPSGVALVGDGAEGSIISQGSAAAPVILLGSSLQKITIRGLTVTHSGTATSGGDGIAQGQGTTDWVNDGTIVDVISNRNYEGFNLGKCFYAEIRDCEATFNVHSGIKMTTTGNSAVPGAAGGPLQWYLADCLSGSNGYDGFSWNVTGTAFGGAGVGSSVGNLESCKTYHNGHHGVAAYGSDAHPLNSIRILGGFYGEDLGNGIYMDTWGRDHVIAPDFVELCGQYGIDVSANNADVVIKASSVSANFWDGLHSLAANVQVIGGNYVNNGVAGTSVENFGGINIAAGSALITGISSGNFNSTLQQYGIRVTGDNVAITGCRLPKASTYAGGTGKVNGAVLSVTETGNVIDSIYWNSGPTNSIVNGCLPIGANSTGGALTGGTVTGNLTVTGTITAGTDLVASGNTHLNGAVAVAGGVTLVGGASITGATSGITVRDIQATRSAGVGSGGSASGVDGQFKVGDAILIGAATGGYQSGAINVPSAVKLNNVAITGGGGGNAFTGDVTITSGRLIIGGQVVSSTTGVLASAGGLAMAGAITGATNITASGTITAGTDLVSNGTFHANGAAAFTAGGVTITSGGLAVTGGISTDNIYASISVGVGVGAPGVTGILQAGGLVTSATSSLWDTTIRSLTVGASTGAASPNGLITMQGVVAGIYKNGTAYNNP